MLDATHSEIPKTQVQSLVKRALSAHATLGIAISAVLYIICLSGTVSVFKDEIHRIEQRGEPSVSFLSPAAAQVTAANGILADPETAHLYIHMPTAQYDRAIVETDNKETYVDAEGEMSGKAAHLWSNFLIDLHYYLHLPKSFGMIVVAIFGVFLFAMSITGFIAHPRVFKDAFAFRRSKSEQIKQVDLHNRLSVWTAPFHISNSLSGAMIGLAVFSIAALAPLKYDGDREAVYSPVYGAEPVVDEGVAPLARIDLALDYMAKKHPDKPVVYVILHDPQTAGQYLQIMAAHPRRLIYAEKYNFNGQGDFLDTTGSADGTVGQQVADSVYKVHFGQFGGMPVKIAFGIFGICLMFIISAGMNIYFLKRRNKGHPADGLQGVWKGIIWGGPMLLLGTFIGVSLLPVLAGYLTAIFWIGLVSSGLVGALTARRLKP